MTGVEALAEALLARGLTLAVAESCTGGLLGATLTALPGSSRWFAGGVIAYRNEVKTDVLGVDAELLRHEGAVSASVATAMADSARQRCHADIGVGITGIAGPSNEGSSKPVGLIHVCASSASAHADAVLNEDRGRQANRTAAVDAALRVCLDVLTQSER